MERSKILKEIEKFLGKNEEFYEEVKNFGRIASENQINKTQLASLENLALSTENVYDILTFIKKQASKHEKWRKKEFSKSIINFIEKKLKIYTESVIKNFNEISESDKYFVYLVLTRKFINALVIEFNYQESIKPKGNKR